MISTCQQLILIFLFFFEASAVAVPTGDFGQLFGVRVLQQCADPVRERTNNCAYSGLDGELRSPIRLLTQSWFRSKPKLEAKQ
jgi:hypothetical protein